MQAIRLVIGAFLAAVLMFFWGFLFWSVLPVSKSMMDRAENEDALIANLKGSLKGEGFYFLPFPDGDAMDTSSTDPKVVALQKKHAEGPLVTIIYQPKGVSMEDMGRIMAMGFGHMFVSALLAGSLLILAAPNLKSYFARVLFVFGLAVFASFTLEFSDVIWFHHPLKFHLVAAGYALVGWLLAGLALGALIRHKPVPTNGGHTY